MDIQYNDYFIKPVNYKNAESIKFDFGLIKYLIKKEEKEHNSAIKKLVKNQKPRL